MRLRHLDLFSGIGGFSLGLEATGSFKTVAFCDIEKYCLEILEKRFPGVPRYTDIKELTYDKLKADGIISKNKKIDIITGGYPCQPFSVAGRKKGEEDPRHLWPEYFRIIKELRPSWVIGENVSGHIKLGLDTVLENLESEGYSARTFSISASSVGANHQRERVWIVANSNSSRDQGKESRSTRKENEKEISDREKNSSSRFIDGTNKIFTEQGSAAELEHVEDTRQHEGGIEPSRHKESIGRGSFEKTKRTTNTNQTSGPSERGENTTEEMANTDSERRCGGEADRENAENVGQSSRRPWDGWWDLEPNVGRVAHGIPKRVDRLKSLGNSLVPSIPYYIGLSIIQSYMANTDGEKSFLSETSRNDGEDR